ncbi:MAG: LacI family transcriptional regulator, partial [Acidobacteria bacterium]|nr:LacI family transcriptional regulator [Acidobacteriota bacterium]
FGRAIEGLELELRGHAYTLMLFGLSSTEHRRGLLFNRNMVRKQIAGLVVLCLSLNPEELDQLHRTEIPLIAVGGAVHGLASIRIDDAQAAADATNHLISLGHRDIAQLRGSVEEDSLFTVPGLRSGAFAATMAAAGLSVREQWNVSGEYNVESGVRAAQMLFDSTGPRPTAVFCGSDEMALGLMLEAHRRGIRVPQDVSVIGIDDHDFAQAAGLTTIRQDPSAQGRLAAKLLLGEIAGRKDVSDVVAPHELVVRTTTAPPR